MNEMLILLSRSFYFLNTARKLFLLLTFGVGRGSVGIGGGFGFGVALYPTLFLLLSTLWGAVDFLSVTGPLIVLRFSASGSLCIFSGGG